MLGKLAKLKVPVEVEYYQGYWCEGKPAMSPIVTLPVGTTVKVVMVSRLGDVGITEDLSKERGYGARINPLDLEFENAVLM